jgi:16S rRNA processing protein RimM
VHGEVRVKIHSDQPERFGWLDRVFVGEESPIPVQVERVRFHRDQVIIKLAGVDSRDQADSLRGEWLQVPVEEAIPLAEGEFFLYQLIGLQVETASGEPLGEISDVLQTGANDVFVVSDRASSVELLLPDIPDVVLQIDLESGRIVVDIPPGLREK